MIVAQRAWPVWAWHAIVTVGDVFCVQVDIESGYVEVLLVYTVAVYQISASCTRGTCLQVTTEKRKVLYTD